MDNAWDKALSCVVKALAPFSGRSHCTERYKGTHVSFREWHYLQQNGRVRTHISFYSNPYALTTHAVASYFLSPPFITICSDVRHAVSWVATWFQHSACTMQTVVHHDLPSASLSPFKSPHKLCNTARLFLSKPDIYNNNPSTRQSRCKTSMTAFIRL